MKFVDTNNLKNKLKSVSKSKLMAYEKCPLMAYKTARDTKPNSGGKALDIGILAHEIAAKKVAELAGIERSIDSEEIMEEYSIEVIYDVTEEIFKYNNFSYLYNNMQLIGVEESISFDMPEIEENFRFNARFDAISFMDLNDQKYIIVDDFKSGYQISTEVDTEAIVYAYAAYKHFGGLPVIFRRIGLRNGKTWEHEFSAESLESMERVIYFKIKHWKDEIEGELVPEYTPGSHCLYCPYLSKCQGRKDVSNLQKKYKAAIWAKQLAKQYENEVKLAAKEVLEHMSPEDLHSEVVVLPFLGDKYGAVAKTTESYQLKTRKVKKAEVISMLIETGEISKYTDSIDIKFSERLSEDLQETFKIPMKKVVKTTISLVEKQTNSEED